MFEHWMWVEVIPEASRSDWEQLRLEEHLCCELPIGFLN